MTPVIFNILADTANFIMASKDVNQSGTKINTDQDHGSGNTWESGCAKPNLWSTDNNNNLN
mgnify:CR=1 FL=1